jgi:cysteine synthase A
MSAPVVSSVLDLIGRTPIVRLRRVVEEGSASVWVKCEHLNPGGSVKDRICLAMIEAAERDGTLRPGMTVVEPTSGNTGIGLAIVCRKKGYKLVLTMPASMSLERRELLKSYGVEIVLTEPERVMDGALEAALRIAEERGAFMPQQFTNKANPTVHGETTAQEILAAFEGLRLDALVAAVGTGGTVTGVGRVLKEARPGIQVVAVEPAASPVLSGGRPAPARSRGSTRASCPTTTTPAWSPPCARWKTPRHGR